MRNLKFGYVTPTAAALAALVGCSAHEAEITQPDILVVVLDDVGFSDFQPFGSEIKTPNINALAEQGKMFTHFHTSPLSAPARSQLMTGVDNHRNGLGNMPPSHFTNQYIQPGYEGYLNEKVMTIPEILSVGGYYTCMSGKWHLGENEHDPFNRGFNDSFALIGGGASHCSNAFPLFDGDLPVTYYTQNGEVVEKLPEDFYSSKNYADKMISYIENRPSDKPFFGYLTFTAAHDPLQIPQEWADRCKGYYDEGYDAIRDARYERMIASGVIPATTPKNHSSSESKVWSALSDAERREQVRKMEIYAAMIEYADMSLGRVIDKLKSSGRYDNTIIFLMTDNGANPSESWMYPGNDKETIESMYDNSIENIGAPNSYVSLGQSWAEICNTPYSLFKHTTMEGGICTPLIVSGKGIESGALDIRNMLHVTDILPTILECADCDRPTHYRGVELYPLRGKSLATVLSGGEETLRGADDILCFEMIENKAVIKGEWKAVLLNPPYGDGKSWQLYNLREDIIEKVDLSKKEPQKMSELIADWEAYASSVGYIKGNGKFVTDVLSDMKLFYTYDKSLIK